MTSSETSYSMSEESAGPRAEGRKRNQYLAAVIAALLAVTIGTALAWTAPVQLFLTGASGPPFFGEAISSSQMSWVGSLIAVGAIVGALPAGRIADRFGRRPVILALTIPFILTYLMILFAQSVEWLYAARFIQGIATGAVCAVVPMFIGEIAESSIRGALGSFFQMFLTLGILYVYILGLTSYEVIAIGCLIIPVVMFPLFFLLVPDTPTYLMKRHRREKAESSLRFYRGPNYDVASELDVIQRELDEAERKKAEFSDLFTSRANFRALIIAVGLMFCQQFSGINTVIFYQNSIFKDAGSPLDPAVSTIIVGVVQCIVTAISTVLVDKAGRRILLLLSDFFMGVCLALLGFYFFLKSSGSDVSSITILPLLSVVLFIVMFSLGYGPVPWIMIGELFAPEVKGSAASIAVCVNWVCAFVITLCFSYMLEMIGTAATFWFFTALCFVGTVFTFFVVLETKGKSLPQIQKELAGKSANK